MDLSTFYYTKFIYFNLLKSSAHYNFPRFDTPSTVYMISQPKRVTEEDVARPAPLHAGDGRGRAASLYRPLRDPANVDPGARGLRLRVPEGWAGPPRLHHRRQAHLRPGAGAPSQTHALRGARYE